MESTSKQKHTKNNQVENRNDDNVDVPYYRLAPCENPRFYEKYLAGSPILKDLMFRNLNHYPFTDDWLDRDVLTMIYLATVGRSRLLGIENVDISVIYSVMMAESIGPFMNKTLYLNYSDACKMLIKSVEYLINNPTFTRRYSSGTLDGYKSEIENPESYCYKTSFTEKYGVPEDSGDIEEAIRKLKYLAITANRAFQYNQLDLIVTITVSICKRGTASENFYTKVENGVMADLGTPCTIIRDAAHHFYQNFGTHIDDRTIQSIHDTWTKLIPTNALRLYLTVTQISGSGLTCYVSIIKAIKLYSDFLWPVIFRMFPEEKKYFDIARTTIKGNLYYGFRRELGACKSTNYKSLSYVAKELLIKVGGDPGLNAYGGWPRNIKNRLKVDQMILLYQENMAKKQDMPLTEEELAEYASLQEELSGEEYINII